MMKTLNFIDFIKQKKDSLGMISVYSNMLVTLSNAVFASNQIHASNFKKKNLSIFDLFHLVNRLISFIFNYFCILG